MTIPRWTHELDMDEPEVEAIRGSRHESTMKSVAIASLAVLLAACSSPGAPDAGNVDSGPGATTPTACGDAGVCGQGEVCVADISSRGTTLGCQATYCAEDAGCACFDQYLGLCPGGPVAGCAIDAGVVQCFAPACTGAPANFCFYRSFDDGGYDQVCVTNWSEVEALGCGNFSSRPLQFAECAGFNSISVFGTDTG